MKKIFAATAILLVLACAPATSAEVNFGAVLTDPDGQPIKDSEGRVLTLGRATMLALGSTYPDDASVSIEDKTRRGLLGLKAYEGKPANLTAEEVALVKKYIGKLYPPLVVVRALPLLDPAVK